MTTSRQLACVALLALLTSAGCGTDSNGNPATGVDGDVTTPDDAGGGGTADAPISNEPFSFFITSLEAMRALSGSQDGFGGDLGGLDGADAICQEVAAGVGFGHKTWKAFLSVTSGPEGTPVHAIDRVGEGPWYDRHGRLVAQNIQGLLSVRPVGDPAIINDLPDEYGRPLAQFGDNHDVLTGSNEQGRLAESDPARTCQDWTSTETSGTSFPGPGGGSRGPMCGHSWPAHSGQHWIAAHPVPGCAAGVNLTQDGGGQGTDIVGGAGGYGGIYCFALTP